MACYPSSTIRSTNVLSGERTDPWSSYRALPTRIPVHLNGARPYNVLVCVGGSHAGSPSRRSRAACHTGCHGCRGPVPDPGHRGEQRDLLARQQPPAAATTGGGPAAPGHALDRIGREPAI